MSDKTNLKYDDYDYTPIKDLVIIQSKGNIVKLWTRRILLDLPIQEVDGRDKFSLKTKAGFQDDHNNAIYSYGFSKGAYIKLREFMDERKPIEVLGEVYKIEVKGGYINGIKIKKFRKAESPLCQMQASRKEIRLVKKMLAEVHGFHQGRSHWVLLDAIKEAAIEIVGIAGTESDDLFSDCLDSAICQAFSGGNLINTNGKIHSCLVGPPGKGKKLIWATAKLINPICQEGQSVRITEAGLTGEMKKGAREGIIPLAHRGVFGIQDFDKSNKKQDLLAIFSDVMEDGRVIIRGAHKADYDAETAIHIDLNRLSDLYLEKEFRKNVTYDVGLPLNIISRFDFIAEFNQDANFINEKTEQIILAQNNPKTISKSIIVRFCEKHGVGSERMLKLIVAYVVDLIDRVNLSPVQKYMNEKFKEIIQKNQVEANKVEEVHSFYIRLINSLKKYVCALTRIQMLEESNEVAVDRALHLLSRKLDFLTNINEKFIVPNYRTVGLQAFQRWLVRTFGSKGFSPRQAIDKYCEERSPCGEKSVRTLRYWIAETSLKKKYATWFIKKEFLDKYGKLEQ